MARNRPVASPPRRRRAHLIAWRLVAGLLVVLAGALTGTGRVAALTQNQQPAYTHSWYINSLSDAEIRNLGAADGRFDSANCSGGDNGSSDKIAVLDFGRIINLRGPGGWQEGQPYYGYGVELPKFSYIQDGRTATGYDTVVYLTEVYAESYFWNTQSGCPQMRVALGASNSYLCEGDDQPYPCDPAAAGHAWADAVWQVESWLQQRGYTSRVNARAASDMETEGGGWSCFGQTRAWADAYATNYTPAPTALLNYGDAITGPQCWAMEDVWYITAGNQAYFGLPEMYGPYNGLCYWTDGSCRGYGAESTRYGAIAFKGTMTQCFQYYVDAYNCYGPVQGGNWGYAQAWQGLWDRQQQSYPGVQTTMPFATNIWDEYDPGP
jgi:hypothetical protein